MAQQAYRKLLILSLLLISILLSACRAHPTCRLSYPDIVSSELEERVDKSLLTGEPCAPPCWYGITPGITSETEALDIVNELEFINQDTINVNTGVRGGAASWQTISNEDSDTRGTFAFNENGIVDRIGFTLLYPVTLQELMDAIGEPDGLATEVIIPYGMADPECMSVRVIWFEQGVEVLAASLPISDETLSLVESNTPVRYVTYYTASSGLREYIETLPSSSKFVPWEGFDQ